MIKTSAKDFAAIHAVNYMFDNKANFLALQVLAYALDNNCSACAAPAFPDYCDHTDILDA